MRLSTREVWDALRTGLPISELVSPLAEDEQDVVLETATDLLIDFIRYCNQRIAEFSEIWYRFEEHRTPTSRDRFAQAVLREVPPEHRVAMFRLYDGKSISDEAWLAVRPVREPSMASR